MVFYFLGFGQQSRHADATVMQRIYDTWMRLLYVFFVVMVVTILVAALALSLYLISRNP